MNYWKELPCDNYNEINQEILNWIEANSELMTTTEFWNPIDIKDLLSSCPMFQEWIISNRLFIKTIAVTIGKIISCCPVHVDTPPARFKLSWPVKNTAGSYNRWFSETNDCETFTNKLGGKGYTSYSNLVEIASHELVAPCIIDAGVPHDVWYPDNSTPAFPVSGFNVN